MNKIYWSYENILRDKYSHRFAHYFYIHYMFERSSGLSYIMQNHMEEIRIKQILYLISHGYNLHMFITRISKGIYELDHSKWDSDYYKYYSYYIPNKYDLKYDLNKKLYEIQKLVLQ